jgi:hypothetical protein
VCRFVNTWPTRQLIRQRHLALQNSQSEFNPWQLSGERREEFLKLTSDLSNISKRVGMITHRIWKHKIKGKNKMCNESFQVRASARPLWARTRWTVPRSPENSTHTHTHTPGTLANQLEHGPKNRARPVAQLPSNWLWSTLVLNSAEWRTVPRGGIPSRHSNTPRILGSLDPRIPGARSHQGLRVSEEAWLPRTLTHPES